MSVLLDVDLDVNPVPLGRPRVLVMRGRNLTTTPPKSAQFYADLRAMLTFTRSVPAEPFSDELEMSLRFWRTCKQAPHRGDLSNLVKAVEDACNPDDRRGWRGIWKDDRQVIACDARIVESGPKVHGHVHLVVRSAETPSAAGSGFDSPSTLLVGDAPLDPAKIARRIAQQGGAR